MLVFVSTQFYLFFYLAGTPFWMAPELLRGASLNTTESDVYAFGILLYEVYSRKEPYEGEAPAEVFKLVCNSIVNKRPPVPKDCPPVIESLMHDCLVSNPEERPSFEELDKRLKRVNTKEIQAEETSQHETSAHRLSSVSLFDIFPKKIAEALRDGKKVEPENHDMVTIFFSDIVGFTDLSATLEPAKVADMLRRFYVKLDNLATEHDVFKVETIGVFSMSLFLSSSFMLLNFAPNNTSYSFFVVPVFRGCLHGGHQPGKGAISRSCEADCKLCYGCNCRCQ
jgi:serine/threonine protein kinase